MPAGTTSLRGLAMLGLLAAGAAAQTLPTPPAEREPNPGVVRQEERALGIAPTPEQQRREAQTTDQLFRELTGRNPNAPSDATPPPPSRTPGQDARATDQLYRELLGRNPNAPGR